MGRSGSPGFAHFSPVVSLLLIALPAILHNYTKITLFSATTVRLY